MLWIFWIFSCSQYQFSSWKYLQDPTQSREQLYLVMAQLLALLFSGLKYAYTKKIEAFCWQYLLSIFPARTKITKSWWCESSVCLFNFFLFFFVRTDFSNIHQNKLTLKETASLWAKTNRCSARLNWWCCL